MCRRRALRSVINVEANESVIAVLLARATRVLWGVPDSLNRVFYTCN